MISFRLLGLAAFAALALSSAAMAQDRGPDLQGLHDALNLSAAQEGAWNAFQTSALPDPDQEARERNAAEMMPTLSAPQRVDLSIAAMRADLDTLVRRGAALKAFYATLSPAQQAVFDRRTAPRAD
jgi:hypothetical protein